MLPQKQDFSQIGVKSKDLHFITAGSKGLAPAPPGESNLHLACFLSLTCSPFPPCRCVESVGGQHGALCLHPDLPLHPQPNLWGRGREGRRPPQPSVPASPAHLLQAGHSHCRAQHTALPAAWSHHTATGGYWEETCLRYLHPGTSTNIYYLEMKSQIANICASIYL